MRLRVIFIGHEEKEFLAEQNLDELLAGRAILQEVKQAEKEGASAVIVDCALDPVLSAMREAVRIPVIGAGQAAFVLATTLGDRFSIISPLRSLIPVYRRRHCFC